MKKYAFTIAEMLLALLLIATFSAICINLFKPDTKKVEIYMYAFHRNLTKANASLMEKEHSGGTLPTEQVEGGNYDKYCLDISDVLSLASLPNCLTDAGDNDMNLQFANKTAIYGISKPWQEAYAGAKFAVKNIMVDIDGPDEGMNKIGSDRFPMRILHGKIGSKKATGMVIPVNCASDKVYDGTSMVDVTATNPYCPNNSTKDFTRDDKVMSFDIYRNFDDVVQNVGSMLSYFEADCSALGGTGVYSVFECDSAHIKINKKCATTEICKNCTSNTCPSNSDDTPGTVDGCNDIANDNNPDGEKCIIHIHKPSGGMTSIFQAFVGDIYDM